MIQIGKRVMLAAMLAAFVSSSVLAPSMNVVFAAEPPVSQEQQTPPQDAPQKGGNEHAGHHG